MSENDDLRALRRRNPEEARALLERMYPDDAHRAVAASFFTATLQRAAKLNPGSWSVTLRGDTAALLVDGLWVCAFWEGEVEVSMIPAALRSEDWEKLTPRLERYPNGAFKIVPGAEGFGVPVEVLADPVLRPLVEAASQAFLERNHDNATALQERTHSPGVVQYLGALLGQNLPSPNFDAEDPSDEPDEKAPPVSRRASRTFTFKDGHYDVEKLLGLVDLGEIALPDLQRPFVWKPSKVRDLFDSMYQGFPVGTMMFWNTQLDGTRARNIGVESKQREAATLVVDGQQRLTSLYSVLRGKPVLDDEFKQVRIEIAFRPRDGLFRVADATTRRDAEWIADISELWTSRKSSRLLVNDFIARLKARRPLSDEDEETISHNLDQLLTLTKYPFSTLEIGKDVDEEAVADIFVRINNGGSRLTQADFILTLLSVHSPETRATLEDFARKATVPPTGNISSPFNPLIQPEAAQLLRTAVAVAFHRARLSAVYQLLRGRNPDGDSISVESRDRHLARLGEAVGDVLDLTHWSQFIHTLVGAGFRSADLISSNTALVNSYALFLIGKLQCSVTSRDLARCIGRWFFAASLSGRYSTSAETKMEEDLFRVKELRDAKSFVDVLESQMASALTNDYWEKTLPNDLDTTGNSPVALAFCAAQIKLNSVILFSDRRIAELYDPLLKAPRKALEDHHLFPRQFLARQGILESRHVNQAANLTLLEWPDNAEVSDTDPAAYVPKMRKRFSTAAWEQMTAQHALPPDWDKLSYEEFLKQRRVRMAQIIRRGFEALGDRESASPDSSSFGTATEKQVWARIESVELKLRDLVRAGFSKRWGGEAEERILQALTERDRAGIDERREKHKKSFPLSGGPPEQDALAYLYLGDLARLLYHGDVWEQFKPIFKEKGALDVLLRSILPVRNDQAHFRAVPEKELQRCAIACDDILTLFKKVVTSASA